ncbi:hypothetical protein AB0D49_28530 [Streptomyces sp. NPDC048290]|uniref:hypothetical protein n=1 Tax=Streptomyces sp. NPDC048290 TaxID=3155811 RepID=UPI00343AE2C5
MSESTAAPWALAWESAHKEATASPVILLQGHHVYLAPGNPITLSLQPGLVTATITPRHSEPVRTGIRIAQLTEDEQRALAGALTQSHRNALLSGQLPAELTDPAHTGGIRIAPAAGQLSFVCTCRQAPCRHTAALGHAVTRRLRTAPPILMTLRGLAQRNVTRLLTDPGSAPAQAAASGPPRSQVAAHHAYLQWATGTSAPAGDEWAHDGELESSVFAAMELPDPPAPAPSLQRLRSLAADAADQARRLLTDGTMPELDPVTDAVRLAASLPTSEGTEAVAHRLGMEPQALRRLLHTHALAGTAGVRATLQPHQADPRVLQEAAAAISPLRPDPTAPLLISDHRITDTTADIQLRQGTDGRWYAFSGTSHDWHLIAPPADEPADAYRGALTALDGRGRPGH